MACCLNEWNVPNTQRCLLEESKCALPACVHLQLWETAAALGFLFWQGRQRCGQCSVAVGPDAKLGRDHDPSRAHTETEMLARFHDLHPRPATNLTFPTAAVSSARLSLPCSKPRLAARSKPVEGKRPGPELGAATICSSRIRCGLANARHGPPNALSSPHRRYPAASLSWARHGCDGEHYATDTPGRRGGHDWLPGLWFQMMAARIETWPPIPRAILGLHCTRLSGR